MHPLRPVPRMTDRSQHVAASDQDGFGSFRVVAHPLPSAAQVAVSRRYADVETAVAAMGEGAVVRSSGHLVAFHERHLPVLERRFAPRPERDRA